MKPIAISQRVSVAAEYVERRDSLDQRWIEFFKECGALPVALPNNLTVVQQIIESIPPCGVVLSGGGNLVPYGGDEPERDAVEAFLISYAIKKSLPLLGICRGMQAIQHFFGIPLIKTPGHIEVDQSVRVNGKLERVNSYHHLGTRDTCKELKIWATSEDAVVKAIQHVSLPIAGIMWHPERLLPFSARDISFFREHFRL